MIEDDFDIHHRSNQRVLEVQGFWRWTPSCWSFRFEADGIVVGLEEENGYLGTGFVVSFLENFALSTEIWILGGKKMESGLELHRNFHYSVALLEEIWILDGNFDLLDHRD